MKKISLPLVVALLLIILGVALRVLRDAGWLYLPPNVAPVSALAMFGAATLPRRWSWAVPIGLMLLSDAIIGWYHLPVMISVYLSFAGSLGLGLWLRRRLGVWPLLGATLSGSVLFFLVTNAAVWAFDGMYPMTLAGLGQSYTAALPFFRNTVLGDLGYTTLFFGLYGCAVVLARALNTRRLMTPHA